ncbi:MAG: polysaccharide pyruvyl transferase family protein [Leptolyngbyaceae cyanobacterium SM1_3_5]|nr:polysaccharide pyruvyl transferase family protein [Leptolyngbyaceae cyanobacterium SM1_3_5]
MKLHFFRKSTPNFGDELNPWLWNQLIPDVFDDQETTAFLGIGTLLNDYANIRVRNARQVVVFSTGVGYSKGLPAVDESWKIYCVRGPLSAQKLGLPESLAVADGALLTRRVFQSKCSKVHRFSYMPHFSQSILAEKKWRSVCQALGFGYIDARWPVDQVLRAIDQTEVLLAEAMHGAILADALRVPWIPVHSTPSILPFKWWDWCASIQVEYQPQQIPALQDLSTKDIYQTFNKDIKGGCKTVFHAASNLIQQKYATRRLDEIAKTIRPTLSKEKQLEHLTVELETRLQQFKEDVQAGYFF